MLHWKEISKEYCALSDFVGIATIIRLERPNSVDANFRSFSANDCPFDWFDKSFFTMELSAHVTYRVSCSLTQNNGIFSQI